jgi:hypothetical protein
MKFSRYLTFGMQIIHGLEFSCFYQKNIFLVQILMIWLFCSLCSLCLVLFVITLIFFPSLLKFLPIAIVTSSALCALFHSSNRGWYPLLLLWNLVQGIHLRNRRTMIWLCYGFIHLSTHLANNDSKFCWCDCVASASGYSVRFAKSFGKVSYL